MLGSLIEGLLLGFGASVPIGPINILIMNEALISYKNAVLLGAGAMSADLTYLTLILIGFVSHIKNHQNILSAIGIIGSIFLLYIAFITFKNRNLNIENLEIQKTAKGIFKSYLKGYSLTLMNPYTIGFWLSVATYVAAKKLNPLLTVSGVIFAITLWITIMPFFVHKTKHFITSKIFKTVNVISSLILSFFGISMLISSIAIAIR